MNQIALPLSWPRGALHEQFLVTPSTAPAVHLLDRWGTWPVRAAILTGPPRSGKSLLARIFAAKSAGRVIDDADHAAEPALFHAWNQAQAERRPLLIVAGEGWTVGLPDLASRLAAGPHAAIGVPDDAMMRALLDHLFHQRGLDARAELVDWLARRIERSHAAIERVVLLLDRTVTERQCRLSIPLARAVLGEAHSFAPGAPEEAR